MPAFVDNASYIEPLSGADRTWLNVDPGAPIVVFGDHVTIAGSAGPILINDGTTTWQNIDHIVVASSTGAYYPGISDPISPGQYVSLRWSTFQAPQSWTIQVGTVANPSAYQVIQGSVDVNDRTFFLGAMPSNDMVITVSGVGFQSNANFSYGLAIDTGATPPNLPDVVVSGFQVDNTTLTAGDNFTATINVTNIGTQVFSPNSVALYLSSGASLTNPRLLMNVSTGAQIVSGYTLTNSGVTSIPTDVAPGTYYLIPFVDNLNTQAEINESNNIGPPVQITVSAPVLVLTGTAGNDVINGSSRGQTLYGLAGSDLLLGNDGNDLLYGDDGYDLLYGGSGADELYGGALEDVLVGDAGDDQLNGGDGNDVLSELFDPVNSGNDFLGGGNGIDIMYSAGGNDTVIGGTDTANNYANLGDGNDSYQGSAGTDVVQGGTGNDALQGHDGDDNLYGEDGEDGLYGGNGIDLLSGAAGNDTMYGGAGNDLLVGDEGIDWMEGGAGIDVLYGGAGDDIISGSTGGDVDALYGGAGADRFRVGGNGYGIDYIWDFVGGVGPSDEIEIANNVAVTGVFTASGNFYINFTSGAQAVVVGRTSVLPEDIWSGIF